MIQENFNSIDKLMAFGMSAAIASQMIRTMNTGISSMQLPGQMPPSTGCPAKQYYVVVGGTQAGPLDDKEMTALIKDGRVDGDTLVWTPGMTGWMQGRNIPSVNKLLLLAGLT